LDEPQRPGSGRWEPIGPPLLTLAIERDEDRRIHRLVVREEPPRIIATGTLEECEARRVEFLKERHGTGNRNVPFYTMGGKQLWRDRFFHCHWRIQENIYTGLCRLLDPGDVRRAWGSFEACRVAFEEIRLRKKIRYRSRHLVILLHGLGRSRSSLDTLSRELRKAGYETASIGYPSTRRTIEEHGEGLEEVLDGLTGVDTVSFVTHSLGGIVAREALARKGQWMKRLKLGRLVMIAPPSQGARMAQMLKKFPPYRLILGPSGQELAGKKPQEMGRPPCSFGIIAGARGDEKGYSPLIPGDDDGVVSVEETRLEGADDFLLVRSLHTVIMNHPDVCRAIPLFLKSGKFQEGNQEKP